MEKDFNIADSQVWDIVIIGAGPAGTSAALELRDSGLRVCLMDKATFPRDKICGDALSPDVIQQLGWIAPSLAERFERAAIKQPIQGLRVYSPSNKRLKLEFKVKKLELGYVVSRIDLDSLMVAEVKSWPSITVQEGTELKSIKRNEKGGFAIETNKGLHEAKLVIGSDGNHSLVAKELAGRKEIDRKHHCAALRQYYQGVEWPEGESHIELHFIDEVLPGYLWVFPMTEGRANVGIGMLSDDVSKKKINLKSVLAHQLSHHPELSKRFQNAKPLESVKGYGIPIGSRRYSLSGEGFILAGDSACLVDPLTGEGIANAIRSGRYAGQYAAKAFEAKDFSASFLKAYDKKIYSLVGDELRLSRFIQRRFRNRGILNATIWLADKSKIYRRLIHLLFEETHFYTQWARPRFYWDLISGKAKK